MPHPIEPCPCGSLKLFIAVARESEMLRRSRRDLADSAEPRSLTGALIATSSGYDRTFLRPAPASSTATIPVRNTPSKVPMPPIDATGVLSSAIRFKLVRSAPISVPRTPLTYAITCRLFLAPIALPIKTATIAAVSGGTNNGSANPQSFHRVGKLMSHVCDDCRSQY